VVGNKLVWGTSEDEDEMCFSYITHADTNRGLYSKNLTTGSITNMNEGERVHGLTIKPEGTYGITNGSILWISNSGVKSYVGTGVDSPWHLSFDSSNVYWLHQEAGSDSFPGVYSKPSLLRAPRSFSGSTYYSYTWDLNNTMSSYLVPSVTGDQFMTLTTKSAYGHSVTRIQNNTQGVATVQSIGYLSISASPCAGMEKELLAGYGSNVYWAGSYYSNETIGYGTYAIWKNNTMLVSLDPVTTQGNEVISLTADNSFVYYVTNTYDIWKVSTSGGTPTLLATNEGWNKLKKDGNYLYYTRGDSIRRMLVQ
jgi:hypothetical protein